MDAGCRDNRWTAYLCTWPPGCSPLVLPPSQEVGSAWVSLSLIGCSYTRMCFRETHSPSRASKTYGHKAFQIKHLHTTVLSTVVAQHNSPPHTRWGASLSADCGYNPGWCLSHHTVSEMTKNVSSGTLNLTVPHLACQLNALVTDLGNWADTPYCPGWFIGIRSTQTPLFRSVVNLPYNMSADRQPMYRRRMLSCLHLLVVLHTCTIHKNLGIYMVCDWLQQQIYS